LFSFSFFAPSLPLCDCQEKSEPLARKILSHYRQKKSEPYWGERWKNIEPLSGEDIRL
jgi:hypothetical protein